MAKMKRSERVDCILDKVPLPIIKVYGGFSARDKVDSL